MASRYEHDYAAFGRLVLRAGFMDAMVKARAERIKSVATAIAPVGNPRVGWYRWSGATPGDYKKSFTVGKGGALDRASARVSNTSDHALAVEFGNRNTPRHRTLGKAMHAGGGKVRWSGP